MKGIDEHFDASRFEWGAEATSGLRGKMAEFRSYLDKPTNNENFAILCNLVYRNFVNRIPIPSIEIHAPILIRSRPNFGDKMFAEEWEISYNSRNPEKIGPGRFNMPGRAMFYGCAPGEPTEKEEARKEDFQLTSCLEACHQLLDDSNNEPYQYFTCGIWEITKPLVVNNLGLNENMMAANHSLKRNIENFIVDLKKTFSAESVQLILEFWKFISDLAAQKNQTGGEHFLTTAYSTAMFAYYRDVLPKEIDGIFYPSPITHNYGINVVVKPEIVDTHLQLKSVYMIKFERDAGDPKRYDIAKCSDEVPVIESKFKLEKQF